MKSLTNRLFLFFVLLITTASPCVAVSLSGRVQTSGGEPLAFANVYIKGTSTGTTTNLDGLYRLEIPEGKSEIVFRYLGYKLYSEVVDAGKDPVTLNVTLMPENYTLAEVNILPEGEDPAYAIIKNAQAKRKFYLNQVDAFKCRVYIKGLQKITKYPKKILGVDLNIGEFVDPKSGIIYLSESVSEYHFKKPDKVKEVMISSKVSGSNKAFSFNQASDMEFNFYNNIVAEGGLNERGFISPIASNAMFYYRYRLEGSFYENGKWVNKIAVLPKRKSDPVFSGYIYIQDQTWRIHSTDLYLTSESQIEFVDTLKINQVYIPANKQEDIWMIGSVTFKFYFSALGIEGNGSYVGVFSKYELTPAFQKNFFKGDVMKVTDDSNKRDSVYWESIRPIPLTAEEQVDYIRKDSIRVVKESRPYLDSLDRKNNKFKFANIISGYQFEDRYTKTDYSISGLLESVQFNTVEGLNIGVGTTFRKRFEDRRYVLTELSGRYGFAIGEVSGSGSVLYMYNNKKFGNVKLSGGSDLVQFNDAKPISPLINTSYSLFSEKNYMKLYRKSFVAFESGLEPVNGIRIAAGISYALRDAVRNHSDFSFVDKDDRRYTSNNPLAPGIDLLMFPSNNALKAGVSARFRIKQKYIDRPDVNYIIGSKYPALFVSYSKGISNVLESDVDYDRIELGLEDNVRLGMLGTLSYYGMYGKFLNNNKVYFMDVSHFNGNKTLFSGFEQKRFDLLDYYSYSTSDEYGQLFLEHSFGGFIMNKIPLLRKLKLNELAGFRALYVPDKDSYFEASFGLEKLGFIRADFVVGFDEKGNTRTGFVFGVKGVIE